MNIAVVGAGIVGLAYAWAAARRGHRVSVFERSARASGASLRNFGMIWPIGQPPGDAHAAALRSRELWLELAREAGLWVRPCGSIHLAHRPDEWAVLEQFAALAPSLGYSVELLTADEVHHRTPAANPYGLLGGLYSPTELCVNPRAAIRALPEWLARRWGIRFFFETGVVRADVGGVMTTHGVGMQADRVIVCSGADLLTLFPDVLARPDLRLCKLQMLKAACPAPDWRIGPHLASGLTLRHYANFASCPGLTDLKARIAAETPELDAFGIHVMASQNDAGEVILGDSHEYDDAIEPFDKEEIDRLILRELQRILRLPEWRITERWHGVYAKHTSLPMLREEPEPGVFIRTGLGGAGMTMSFGLADTDSLLFDGD